MQPSTPLVLPFLIAASLPVAAANLMLDFGNPTANTDVPESNTAASPGPVAAGMAFHATKGTSSGTSPAQFGDLSIPSQHHLHHRRLHEWIRELCRGTKLCCPEHFNRCGPVAVCGLGWHRNGTPRIPQYGTDRRHPRACGGLARSIGHDDPAAPSPRLSLFSHSTRAGRRYPALST